MFPAYYSPLNALNMHAMASPDMLSPDMLSNIGLDISLPACDFRGLWKGS